MSLVKWFLAWLLSFLAILFGAGVCDAADPPRERLGEKVKWPALRDADGNRVELPAGKPVVVAFLSFECPVARDAMGTLSRLAEEYRSKGVTFIGVVPADDTPAEVARQAREFGAAFPVLSDPTHAAVAALRAGHTPEVFVLDADRVLRYRGRVDDKYGARLKPNPKVTRHDLRDALDAVLAGRPVEAPATTPVGCPIPPLARPKLPAAGAVTYYRDVLPILQAHCQECHRPGEVGPFSLMTYKQAANWAEDTKHYTASGKMPPWKAVDGVTFQHDRRMPAAEIATLGAWADAGAPAGDPKDAPPARQFPRGWALGPPDLVLTMDEEMHLGPSGPDHFRCVVLPTGLAEDRFVAAYEVRPGNPRVVHHSVNYFDTTGTARRLAREAKAAPAGPDRGPGYESPMGIGFTPEDPAAVGGVGGWTPGMRGVRSYPGTGLRLPKGSDVVLQLHYHRSGKPETDRTQIGLYFAKDKDLKPLKLLTVPGLVAPSDDYRPFAAIPAGRAGFRVAGKVVVEEDCQVYSVLPHMHMLGAKVRVTVTAPGGPERTVVRIDEWDYNWQELYRFEKPLAVPAGTVFTVEAEFDNTAANPHNPSAPPREVRKGDGTTDEMLFAFLGATSDRPGPLKVRPLTDRADYEPRTK